MQKYNYFRSENTFGVKYGSQNYFFICIFFARTKLFFRFSQKNKFLQSSVNQYFRLFI